MGLRLEAILLGAGVAAVLLTDADAVWAAPASPDVYIAVNLSACADFEARLAQDLHHPESGVRTRLANETAVALREQLGAFYYHVEQDPPPKSYVLTIACKPPVLEQWPRGDLVFTLGITYRGDTNDPIPLPRDRKVLDREGTQPVDLRTFDWWRAALDDMVKRTQEIEGLLSAIPFKTSAHLRTFGYPHVEADSTLADVQLPQALDRAVFRVRWKDAANLMTGLSFIVCLPDRVGGPVIDEATLPSATCFPAPHRAPPPGTPTSLGPIYLVRYGRGQ